MEEKPALSPSGPRVLSGAAWLLCLCCGGFLAFYLRLPHPVPGALLLFALLALVLRADRGREKLSAWENALLGAFAGLFALALVLGFHIVSLAPEKGQAFTERFCFTSYTLLDLPALVFCAAGAFLLTRWVYCRLGGQTLRRVLFDPERYVRCTPATLLGFAGLFFLSGCAWLAVYYPGLIFPDTIGPLAGALGESALVRSRIVYTLFLRLCLSVSHALGKRNDVGVALATLLQLGFVSLSLATVLTRLSQWFHLKKRWTLLLALVFALNPFFGSFAVIVWVNPLFSAGTALLSVLLEELLYRRRPGVLSLLVLFFTGLVVAFLRSNGLGIAAVLALLCLALWLFRRKTDGKRYGPAALTLCAVLVFYFFCSHVIFARMDAYDETSTNYGVFLNQMARVVVYEGDLSEEDLSYLDSILPLERYREAYNPGSVDFLKWDAAFHEEPLTRGFWGHYLSVLRKNPRLCFEAWQLQSHGFWTVNIPEINRSAGNITTGGNLLNTVGQGTLAEYGIEPGTLWQNPLCDRLFPLLWRGLPAGWIFWLLLGVCAMALAARRWRLLIPLLPGLLLEGSVALLTPTYYWQSYVMACYYLLPLYLLWLTRIRNDAAAAE